jgi:hypothetical protein
MINTDLIRILIVVYYLYYGGQDDDSYIQLTPPYTSLNYNFRHPFGLSICLPLSVASFDSGLSPL